MRVAFVVQLQKTNSGNQLEGVVEEVDSGMQARFHSGSELISFLRERSAQIQQGKKGKEVANERRDNNAGIGGLNT